MRVFDAQALGVEQGAVMLFTDFRDNGPMWAGSGEREVRRRVAFSRPFFALPSVSAHIGLWDTDSQTNLRADLTVENVAKDGFELVFRTWADTRIARLRADWMAIGPVPHPDNWEV
ncbi:H-type lectin domain-containing protein [Alkalilacustris brevis]|uniref:H-type lectin domain-containing protein n=1 Tax=Alkalilacustris brevis TaxID=2026338 RepID=UPI000E0CD810|nr:H-type lectin domain-containing protein [Alkalilacustris brevis]